MKIFFLNQIIYVPPIFGVTEKCFFCWYFKHSATHLIVVHLLMLPQAFCFYIFLIFEIVISIFIQTSNTDLNRKDVRKMMQIYCSRYFFLTIFMLKSKINTSKKFSTKLYAKTIFYIYRKTIQASHQLSQWSRLFV